MFQVTEACMAVCSFLEHGHFSNTNGQCLIKLAAVDAAALHPFKK